MIELSLWLFRYSRFVFAESTRVWLAVSNAKGVKEYNYVVIECTISTRFTRQNISLTFKRLMLKNILFLKIWLCSISKIHLTASFVTTRKCILRQVLEWNNLDLGALLIFGKPFLESLNCNTQFQTLF